MERLTITWLIDANLVTWIISSLSALKARLKRGQAPLEILFPISHFRRWLRSKHCCRNLFSLLLDVLGIWSFIVWALLSPFCLPCRGKPIGFCGYYHIGSHGKLFGIVFESCLRSQYMKLELCAEEKDIAPSRRKARWQVRSIFR